MPLKLACFQPNQSGIEILSDALLSFSAPFFQPNQSGIEICFHLDVKQCHLPFNRTKVELKFVNSPEYTEIKLSFNRTKVELKFFFRTHVAGWLLILSTEPKWNWNLFLPETEIKPQDFQPNQSGIEIADTTLLTADTTIFQPNQSGIEIV